MKNIPFLLSRGRIISLGIWRFLSPNEFSQYYRRIHRYTMCWNTRLYALYEAINTIEDKNIKGDIVECGSARGGSAALMGLTLKGLNSKRTLWVYDSFNGIPSPTDNDPDKDLADHYTGCFKGDYKEVESLFSRLGILLNSRLVKGLFQDILPKSKVRKIAVLHVDGDWYDSVMSCLENLYDKVSIGGVIQFDDYGYWEGARKAVDDFMEKNTLKSPLLVVDYEGRQWIKSKERIGATPH